MMRSILLTCLLLLVVAISAFSQDNRISMRQGIEFDIIPLKFDNFTQRNHFSLSAYVGYYGEVAFSKQFTTKLAVGVHNVYYRDYAIHDVNTTVSGYVPTEGKYATTIAVAAEPRWYFNKSVEQQGCYVALPISFETGPLQIVKNKSYIRMRMIPTIGYRYALSAHWFVEANAGLGWGEILRGIYPSLFEYSLQARLAYCF